MTDVQEALDRLVPVPARRSDWGEVLRDARLGRRSLGLQLTFATAVAALVALFVVAPWQGTERVGVLDRALAAVGDGPVLHLVMRDEWSGTLIDLKTGERKPLYSEDEMWIDPARGFVQVSRFGGAVTDRHVATPDQIERPFAVAAADYRDALESGEAKVAGSGVVDGVPVYWIRVEEAGPGEPGRARDWGIEVGVSKESYKPVQIREVIDGSPTGPGTRILLAEQLPADAADFQPGTPPHPGLMSYEFSRAEITREDAVALLDGHAAWLGPEFDGLPLGRISEIALKAETKVQKAVRLVYAERLTFDGLPRSTPSLIIEQTEKRHVLLEMGLGKYPVPEGYVALLPGGGGSRAYVSFEGTFLVITAHAGDQSDELALEAARGLRSLSGGNGGGE